MYSVADTPKGWVAPFGYPRIKACSRLPVAFRSVPRPSSPPGAKASTECPSLARDRTRIPTGPPCTETIHSLAAVNDNTCGRSLSQHTLPILALAPDHSPSRQGSQSSLAARPDIRSDFASERRRSNPTQPSQATTELFLHAPRDAPEPDSH